MKITIVANVSCVINTVKCSLIINTNITNIQHCLLYDKIIIITVAMLSVLLVQTERLCILHTFVTFTAT